MKIAEGTAALRRQRPQVRILSGAPENLGFSHFGNRRPRSFAQERTVNHNDHSYKSRTAPVAGDVFHCAEDARHSHNGFWLTKRRDGRSDNWMIARYDRRTRSIIYRSSRTTALSVAIPKLHAHAEGAVSDKPVRARKTGFVYFIGAATGQVKIGSALDVGRRLAALSTMSPVPLTVLAITTGGKDCERTYHAQFAEHRLHGEWFERSPSIESEIERLGGGVS